MLASLTWKLIVVPESAWTRLAAACDQNQALPASDQALPAPAMHAAAVGGVSILATLAGISMRDHVNVGTVIITVLAAVAGYVGSAVLAATWLPTLLSNFTEVPAASQPLVSRFAAAASVPVIASGIANLFPLSLVSVMAVALGAVLTFRSGSLGARAFLGMEGAPRNRAATLTTVVSTLPAFFAALVRATR